MLKIGRILIADDDQIYRERLGRSFQRVGHETILAKNGWEALRLAESELPTAAVLDLRMPSMDGLQCLRELRHLFPAIPIVMLTGYGSIANALEAVREGALDYLTKPADAEQILSALAGERSGRNQREESVPSLERLEWEHIQRVLRDSGGNVTHAAAALGMHRRTLQRKLQKFPPSY